MTSIPIVNVGYDSTNYYVLAGKLLIDVGFPGTLPKLQHTCKRMGVNLAAIPYLLCTHYHPDHAGLAQELKRTGLKLIAITEQVSAIPTLRTFMKPQQNYVDITLDDNLVLTTGDSRAFLTRVGLPGEIIHTPGHSDDSITLILDTGQAFTGDLPHPNLIGDDTQSWQQIRTRPNLTIYPGHGREYKTCKS